MTTLDVKVDPGDSDEVVGMKIMDAFFQACWKGQEEKDAIQRKIRQLKRKIKKQQAQKQEASS